MPKSEIPADVRRFILARILSVPHVEALLLLRSTAPSRWSAQAIAERLYVRTATAAAVLDSLHELEILSVEKPSSYFFDLRPGPLHDVIDALACLYTTHLVEITHLIHSKMDRKAQQLAEAFNFRKDS